MDFREMKRWNGEDGWNPGHRAAEVVAGACRQRPRRAQIEAIDPQPIYIML
jgi:hypothetical protein